MSPYIEDMRRYDFKTARDRAEAPGELTYLLFTECLKYLHREGVRESFAHYAEVLGALEATKLELYRRHVAPYEDKKLKENGDVNV